MVRFSAQSLCALLVWQCIGCGTQPTPSGETGDIAQTRHAEESSGPQFDWLQFNRPGDVTAEVQPYIQDHKLDLGSGVKISTSDAVKLVRAEIESGKLVLTLQMNQPEQSVRIDGLKGARGNYRSRGAGIRPVTIAGASHEEKFAQPGVLQIGINHPHPEQIAVAAVRPPSFADTFQENLKMMEEITEREEAAENARLVREMQASRQTPPKESHFALPGPESGYAPRFPEFAQLAAAVSALYKMPGRDTFRTAKDIDQVDGECRMEIAQVAATYPDPQLQKYATKLVERLKADQNVNLDVVRSELRQRARAISENINNNVYVKPVTRFGITNYVDDSGDARAELAGLTSKIEMSDEKLREYVKQQGDINTAQNLAERMSNNRDHLFQNIELHSHKILTERARQIAGPKSTSCLIEMFRVDSSAPALRNTSGKTLTDVVVELSRGFSRSDKLKTYGIGQFVFIPIWKPNEKVELAQIVLDAPSVMHAKVNVYANEACSEGHEFSIADPHHSPNNNPGTLVFREHNGLIAFMKPDLGGAVWIEIDGRRVNWDDTDQPREISSEPGAHTVKVFARDKQKRTRVVYDETITLDGEEAKNIYVSFVEKK